MRMTSELTDRAAWQFTLFVAGDDARSRLARENLNALCAEDLGDACRCTVIDVFEDFEAAAAHNVLITPTLLIKGADAVTIVIGDLSDREELWRALRTAGARPRERNTTNEGAA